MEHLSTLEKIYLYGETLSSEEMNLIIAYVNNTIDAVNTLIRNNNGINSGHCELRYKNSSSQPLKPTTGSNGLTNGWSNTYSLPNTSLGETAWMTICFVTGENVYGEWSTPVCISWGSVTGQQGPPGQAGIRGSFISRIFKRANSKPDTPTGGTYDNPIPSGWYDGIPDGAAIIWSSTCTFYGNGTQSGWSEPAQESDTTTLDIEFSPSTIQPSAPLGNNPFSNHEIEGWYDPSSPNFNSVGPMVWRAERKVSNGEYDGNWTITRIFGEKGELGLSGEAGGHYEFRYKNYKPTLEVPVPVKPSTGSEGRSNGWSDTLTTLSEMLLRDGIVTWMTQCLFDEHGYGTWSNPIRITGGNGIDGNDGTDYEFIYTRNNTGETPYTPPTTQRSRAELFGNLGIWVEPDHNIAWTDDPQGVDDTYMWEFVSTRTKQGGLWSSWTDPVVWANWGKQGKIGPMSYLAGEWKSNVTYTKTAEKNPVVYHNNNYYYLRGEITTSNPSITSIGQSPTGTYTGNNTNPWALAENFEMVFTDILFVNDFAKLSSFIINLDWMISKNGTLYYRSGGNTTSYDVDASHSPQINGTTYNVDTAYVRFDSNCPNVANSSNTHKNPNFVPAIAIDSLSGRCFFWKGYFKGDVYANSLHLGNSDLSNLPSTIDGINGSIGTINTSLGNKLEIGDISVSNDTTSGGLTKKTITITKGNNTKTFTLINEGNFVLTDIGRTGPSGSYFKVSTEGLMEAHNAIVYGTVFATDGQFSGSVNATTFTAGDKSSFNVEVTSKSIDFKYGNEKRAWFTTEKLIDNGNGGYTVDNSASNVGGFYLYMISPEDGSLITIDFADLSFKRVVSAGNMHARRLVRLLKDSNNYVNKETVMVYYDDNNHYYSNSEGTLDLNIANLTNVYEEVSTGGLGAYQFTFSNGTRDVLCNLSMYRTLTLSDHVLTRNDNSSLRVFTMIVPVNDYSTREKYVQPTGYEGTLYNSSTLLSTSSNSSTIENSYPRFEGGSIGAIRFVDYSSGNSITTTNAGSVLRASGNSLSSVYFRAYSI